MKCFRLGCRSGVGDDLDRTSLVERPFPLVLSVGGCVVDYFLGMRGLGAVAHHVDWKKYRMFNFLFLFFSRS